MDIQETLEMGIDAHKDGKIENAKRYYEAILKVDPNHADANHNLGVLNVGLGNERTALDLFEVALNSNPSVEQFWVSKIKTLIKLHEFDEARNLIANADLKNETTKQLEIFADQTEHAGKITDPPNEKLRDILESYTRKQFQNVLKSVETLEKDYSSSPILLNISGAAYSGLKQYDLAIKRYERALEIKPDFAEAWYNAANTFKLKGQISKAIRYFEEAIKYKPNYSEALNNLGQIYFENKDYLNAEVNLRKATNVSRSNKDACCNLGILLLEMDKTDEAIHLFKKVLDLDSKYTKAFFNLGNTYMKINATNDAISNFEKVLLIEPTYFQAFNNLGNAYKLQHKYKKAIECYQKAIVLKADYSDAYFNLANTYRDIKDFQTAIVNYLKAIEINPKNCDARFNIADVLRKSGEIDKAIEQYKIVLELRPNWASAKHMLNSLIGSDATSVPSKYITDVFDHYAPNFDNSLLNELKYVAPIKLIEKLQSNDQDLIFNNAVELGCGTGLLGEHLIRFCQNLIGVDISKKMLDVAKAKNIYDSTINMDISEFLMQDRGVYDLYIAADVFIYVGDLEQIFDLIAKRSGHRKYLAFSTEHCDGVSFELQKSGRFAHSKNYIERLCEQYKFNLKHVSIDDLREESGIPVLGGYYIATK